MTGIPAEAIPAAACTAIAVALQAYEPEATALLMRNPSALLGVLLEAGRRAAVAAAPLITVTEPGHARDLGYLQGVSEGTAAERERIRQGLGDLGRKHPPFIYFGRAVAAVLDGGES